MFCLILPCLLWSNSFLSNQSYADTLGSNDLLPPVEKYVGARSTEFDQISQERKDSLAMLAEYIQQCRREEKPCKLVFICTHNSRRSHMAQVWAQVAAARYGLTQVQCYSGGTAATALNPRTVATLKRAGIEIKPTSIDENSPNPKYQLKFSLDAEATEYFSKRFDDPTNPSKDFAAIMTCSDADRSRPTVAGSAVRIALPFDDPKIADNTADEAKAYDLRCQQIACEMIYTMSLVSKAEAKIAEPK